MEDNHHQGFLVPAAHVFWESGHTITKHNTEGSIEVGMRRFRALFGCTPDICAWMWNYWVRNNLLPVNSQPIHLLYGLLHLKIYAIEEVYKSMTGADEKTFRKWAWTFIELMAYELDVVSQEVNQILIFFMSH
jgi:hypothetical protein